MLGLVPQRLQRLERLERVLVRLEQGLALDLLPLAPRLAPAQVLRQQVQQGRAQLRLEQLEQRVLRQLQGPLLEPPEPPEPLQRQRGQRGQRLVRADLLLGEVRRPFWQLPSSPGRRPHRSPGRRRRLPELAGHRSWLPQPSWLPTS